MTLLPIAGVTKSSSFTLSDWPLFSSAVLWASVILVLWSNATVGWIRFSEGNAEKGQKASTNVAVGRSEVLLLLGKSGVKKLF